MNRLIRSDETSQWVFALRWMITLIVHFPSDSTLPFHFCTYSKEYLKTALNCVVFFFNLLKTLDGQMVQWEDIVLNNSPSIGAQVSFFESVFMPQPSSFPSASVMSHTWLLDALLSQWQKQQQPVAWQPDWVLAGEPSIRHGCLLCARVSMCVSARLAECYFKCVLTVM